MPTDQEGANNTLPHVWMVPYERNHIFTGRKDILALLHEMIFDSSSVVLTQTISGLGGIGKTQAALEYAYRYRYEYDVVLWANASSPEQLLTDFQEIANRLDLPERQEQDQHRIIAAVERWLREHERWLLVFDNADDLRMVQTYIPRAYRGQILLTSRAQAVGTFTKQITLDAMPPEEGACLLLRSAAMIKPHGLLTDAARVDQLKACEISQEFGGLPLALNQAGAYIKEIGCSLENYLNLYRQQEGQLLKERGTIDTSDYTASVATTWSLSVQKIAQTQPAAINLLRVCTFLHPDAIPLYLITKSAHMLGAELQTVVSYELEFDNAIKALRNFSLVQNSIDGNSISVHRLVQAVFKSEMGDNEQQIWGERVLKAVNHVFPSVIYENWSTCQQVLPHALVCAEWLKKWNKVLPEGAQMLLRAGYYVHVRALDQEAEPLLLQAITIFEQVYGGEHSFVAQALNNLALIYKAQSRYDEAEPLLLRARAIDEKTQGLEPSEITRTLTNLGILYLEQSRFEEAEPYFQKALAIDEQLYGPDHLEVATDLHNLSLLYRMQRRYKEAEPLARRALNLKEQAHGLEHPIVADNVNDLASICYEQERYEEAEQLYKRALMIRQQVYEAEHPKIASSQNNLAIVYKKQGKFAEAETYYKEAIATKKQAYGESHPLVANSLNNLGQLYEKLGNYREAEPLFRCVQEIRERTLGHEHTDVGRVLSNLGMLYYHQGRYNDAESILLRAQSIFQKAHGISHWTTADIAYDLGLLYIAQSKLADAELLLRQALSIYLQLYDSEHPDVISCKNLLDTLDPTQITKGSE